MLERYEESDKDDKGSSMLDTRRGSQILTAGVLDFCLEHSYCLNQKAVILVIF